MKFHERLVRRKKRWDELHERWKKGNQTLIKLLLVQEIMREQD
jgi:hypothetical protein